MNPQSKVIEIIADVLDNVDVDVSVSRYNTPTWNSLKHMEIIFAIEEEFDIQYTEAEMIAISSVMDIVESIKQKQS